MKLVVLVIEENPEGTVEFAPLLFDSSIRALLLATIGFPVTASEVPPGTLGSTLVKSVSKEGLAPEGVIPGPMQA